MNSSLFLIAMCLALAPALAAQSYVEFDFESDVVGGQPAGGFTFSPSSNTATNGAVVVDASSTPASPLSGRSLHVYDLNGDGSTGVGTHLRRDFHGGTNVSTLRVDFDFQRAYAASNPSDENTRIHFAVGRAGANLNNSDFRPFEIRILNNGSLVVNSIASTATVGSYLTDAPNHLTILINSHDAESVDYNDPALGSGSVQPNTFHLFLNGVTAGVFTFHRTPDPVNAPEIDFYAENNDLGRFAFYQDSSRQGGIVFDNLVLRDLAVVVPVLSAPSGLAAQAVSPTAIHLTWADNATGEAGYVVERKSGAAAFAPVAQLAADTKGFTDSGLQPETEYTYRVIARAGTVVSNPSNEAATTTPEQVEPLIVDQDVPALVVAGDDASVSVSALGRAPLSYQWYAGASGDAASPIAGATQPTVGLPGLTQTTSVWVRVTNTSGFADSDTIVINVRAPVVQVVRSKAQLDAAISAAGPGDAILLADGTWNDLVIRFTGEGTEAHPITLGAETPGHVVLTGASRIEMGGSHLVVRDLRLEGTYRGNDDEVIQFRRGSGIVAQHCRLTNVSMIDYCPADGARTFWVSLYGTANRVDHCYFSGHNVSGVTVVVWPDGQPNHHRIDHNHFANRTFGGENGWETIRVGTSDVSLTSSRTTVDHNLFTRVDGEIEIISNKSCDNVYHNNAFVESQGTLTLRHGDRCTVDSNTFLGRGRPGTGGVRVIGTDHVIVNNMFEGTTARDGAAITVYAGVPNSPLDGYFAAHRATIGFNTFVDNTGLAIEVGTGLGSSNRTELPMGVRVANNLMAQTQAGTGPFAGGPNAGSQSWTTNLIHHGTAGTTASGGFVAADPGLRWNALRQHHLPAPDGPVAHAATLGIIAVAFDIEGRPRSFTPDAGAFEVSSLEEPLVHGPVSAVTTGPDYLASGRVPATPNARLVNHSTRAMGGAGDGVLIGGFIVDGTEPKSLLVRAVGPGLAQFGVEGTMAQPSLMLFNAGGTVIAANIGWQNGPALDLREAAEVAGAFPLAEASADSALAATLAPGAYTAHAVPADGTAGVVLLEVYDLTQGQGIMCNQSMRGSVGPGQEVLVAGFVVEGVDPRRVLVRAAGPSLGSFGVSDAIGNPRLALFDGSQQLVAENDAWWSGESAAEIEAVTTEVGAFPFAAGSEDAAILITLEPGLYSAHALGVADAAGTVLVEVYLVD